ncbi:LPXTG cell wall anchor domain protein [Staphylococcus aureus subsp. aureus 21320]|nr:LPXTG cell wall anchor domain protein [Staphylococcus aureus subsp. aureus 21320]
MSTSQTHFTSTSISTSKSIAPNTNESQSTLSATSVSSKHDAEPAQSEERLPDTGDSIKQNGLLGGVMTLLVGLGLMKRKKKKDENDQDDSQA